MDWTQELAQAFAQHLLDKGASKVQINGPDLRGAYHFVITGCPLDQRQLNEERDKFQREYNRTK